MVIKHLTDDEVQQYVVDKQPCEVKIVEHIHFCEVCRAKVEVYQLMIKGIKQQPQPAFAFDLSKMVLQQLPQSKPKVSNDRLLLYLVIFIGLGFTAGVFYYFQNYFKFFFEGISIILGFLIGITALAVLAGLYIDMYKKYRKEMKVLDLY
jgi:hypothetical protein